MHHANQHLTDAAVLFAVINRISPGDIIGALAGIGAFLAGVTAFGRWMQELAEKRRARKKPA